MLEIVATLTTFVGVFLISRANKNGFHIQNVSQTCWAIFAYQNMHYMLMIQAIALILLNCYGLYQWRKKKVGI